MTTYTLTHYGTNDTTSGLTLAQCIHEIYTNDGGEYWLEPKMEAVYDSETGEEIGERQATSGDDLEFEVWFRESANMRGKKSQLIARGKNHDDALANFLEDAAKNVRYDTRRWGIYTDADHAAYLAQCAEAV